MWADCLGGEAGCREGSRIFGCSTAVLARGVVGIGGHGGSRVVWVRSCDEREVGWTIAKAEDSRMEEDAR